MKGSKGNSDQLPPAGELSLETLAAESRVAERTIRYYITRGLLAGPVRCGRGAFYTGEHLKRLQEIRRRQQQGLTLTEIERMAATGEPTERLPEAETWWAYKIAPDVVVQIRSGTSPWRLRQVRAAFERLAHELFEK